MGITDARRRGRGRERERGSVSIEMVLVLPLALLLLLAVIQAAVYYQARSAAMAAAQEGSRGAAAYRATDGDGRAEALTLAAKVGGDGVLDAPQVEVSRDAGAGTVTVTVTGRTLSVVPGWDPEVSQSATRPIEDLSAPEDYQKLVNRFRDDPIYKTSPLPQDGS